MEFVAYFLQHETNSNILRQRRAAKTPHRQINHLILVKKNKHTHTKNSDRFRNYELDVYVVQ
jgi:hypothetical protein